MLCLASNFCSDLFDHLLLLDLAFKVTASEPEKLAFGFSN